MDRGRPCSGPGGYQPELRRQKLRRYRGRGQRGARRSLPDNTAADSRPAAFPAAAGAVDPLGDREVRDVEAGAEDDRDGDVRRAVEMAATRARTIRLCAGERAAARPDTEGFFPRVAHVPGLPGYVDPRHRASARRAARLRRVSRGTASILSFPGGGIAR